jgi:methionyl-tRNA synthetase
MKKKKKKRILVCSAWPYGSGIPHLGNLVSSLLSGDVFARYYRMRGHEVLYVSGTDAHGTRIEYEARQRGVSPAAFAAQIHERICSLLDGFGIQFDNYTITESPVHTKFVREIYLRMEAEGYIFTQDEERAYCRNCRLFLADRFIMGRCPRCGALEAKGNQCDACGSILEPEELLDPVCNFCGRGDIEFRSTRHWYLDLAKLAPKLNEYVMSRDFQGNVRLFTQRMIDEGLRPRAMTRDIAWGIPAPFDGANGKVIYVWGEAALGYVSSTMEYFGGDEQWKTFWFGDNVYQIYAMGKDNIPFHTLIFPGQLIASGQGYHLPDQIAATEYLNWINGAGFSKSRGIGLYCDTALEVMEAELWRFYLLYNRPEGRDVNFSWEELEKAVNGVLISNVSNLINRVLSFIQTKCGRVVPAGARDSEVVGQVQSSVGAYEEAMNNAALSQALRTVCSLAVFGNEYFQRKKPWENNDAVVLTSSFYLVKSVAILLFPFLPRFSQHVLAVMGISRADWQAIERTDDGLELSRDRVLLDKIDVEAIRKRVDERTRRRVNFEEFDRLDLRVGTIRTVAGVPDSDRLYQLTIDVGDRVLTTVAGIKPTYSEDGLVDRQVIVVVNIEPTQIKGIVSECMLLATKGEPVSLLKPDRTVPPGESVG